jgi:hypothetical protein
VNTLDSASAIGTHTLLTNQSPILERHKTSGAEDTGLRSPPLHGYA